MGAPWHRVQNPANPCKPAGTGEALITQGKGCRPTYATSAAVGQAETPKGNLRQGKLRKPQAPEEEHGTRLKTKRRTKDTANPTYIAPPQEQGRQLELEMLRNPLRVTCSRTSRGKPQAPQEEAQKQHQQEAQQLPTPRRAGGEKEDTAPPPQKGPTHTRRDNQ